MTQPNRQSANFFPFVFFLLEKGRKVFSSSASSSGSADNFQIVPFTLFPFLYICSSALLLLQKDIWIVSNFKFYMCERSEDIIEKLSKNR